MQGKAKGCRTDGPQSQHGMPRFTNPEESNIALGRLKCELKTYDVSIKFDRTLKITNCHMCFEQMADRDTLVHTGYLMMVYLNLDTNFISGICNGI